MKRKLKYLIFCFFITIAFYLQAKEFTLTELVSVYLIKSYGQKIRVEQLQKQKLILENQKATFYPNLSTNFQLPGHYYSKQNFSLNNSNINEYDYLQSKIVLQEILPWNSELSFSKSFTANLYNDSRYYSSNNNIGFKYYLFKKNVPKLNYQYSKLQYEELTYQQKESLNFDIIALAELYYQAVMQKIKVEISQNNLERNQKLLQMAEIKYKSGVIDILTKNQIELQTREDDFTLKKQKQELQYYLQQLANKLGVKNIEDIDRDFSMLFFRDEDFNLGTNSEILKLQTQLISAEINYELTSAQFDWHFILGGEYNWGGDGGYLEEFGSSIGTDNYTVYLGIELPLYDGRINKRDLAKRRAEKNELVYQLQQKINELKSRWIYLTDKIKLIESELELLNDNVKLAKDNLEIATDKLLRGDISYSDWSQIEASYEQTELNLVNQKILLNKCILENYNIGGKNLVNVLVSGEW